MSFNNQGNSSGGSGCAKAFGIGCGGLALMAFLSMIMLTNGLASAIGPIFMFGIIGIIIFVIVRQNRSTSNSSKPGNSYEPATSQLGQPRATAPAPGPDSSAAVGRLGNPICTHTFAEDAVASNAAFTCPCGNYFEAGDIIKYNQLLEKRIKINAQLFEIRDLVSLKQNVNFRSDPNAVPVKKAAAQGASSLPTGARSVAKPSVIANEPRPTFVPAASTAPIYAEKTISRPKVAFSLQQWLIIAASLLVLIAGTVFVNTGIQSGWPFWIFAIVTVSIGAATGFGSFKLRKMSAVISSFLAAFSAAMQLATMSILGDQISNGTSWDFIWSSMPSWWWTISLLVVAAISLALARLSSVFGYKAIALLATTTAAFIFDFGFVVPQLSANWAPINLAVLTLAAVAIAAESKFVRNITAPALADETYKDYAEDLAKREDNGLAQFTRFAAPLLVVAGLAAALIKSIAGLNVGDPLVLNPVAVLVVALAWAGVSFTADRYSSQITKDGSASTKLSPFANAVVFISATVALVQCTLPVDVNIVASPLTLAAIVVLALAGPALGRFKTSAGVANLATYVGAAFWLQFEISNSASSGNWNGARYGWFALAFGFALTFIDRRYQSKRNALPSAFINGIALIVLFSDFKSNADLSSTSLIYALLALAVVLAPNARVALDYVLNGRRNAESLVPSAWVAFGFSAALLLLAAMPNASEQGSTLEELLGLAFAFMVYSAVAYVIGQRKSVLATAKPVFTAHHYLGQLMSVLLILFSVSSINDLSNPRITYTTIVAGLIVLNYAIGAVARQSLKLQIGYVLMLAAFFINMWGVQAKWLLTVSTVQFLSVALLTGLHAFALARRTSASGDEKRLTVLIGIGASLLIGLGAQAISWQTASGQDAFFVLALIALIAGLCQLVSRIPAIAKSDLAKKIYGELSLSYAAFALVTIFSYSLEQREIDARWYAISALAVFTLVTYIQRIGTKLAALSFVFLLSNLALSITLATLAYEAFGSAFVPEVFSVFGSLALILSSALTRTDFGKARRYLLVEIPLLGTAVFSLLVSIATQDMGFATTLREILGSATIATFALIKVRSSSSIAWISASYLASIATAEAIAHTVSVNLLAEFNGPEIYSLPAAAAIIGVHQLALKKMNLKGTLFSFGLPIGVALVPSTIYTYADWGASLSDLAVAQIVRVLAVLIVSALLLTLGLRKGNLANASMGVAGLTLLVVPMTASQSSGLGVSYVVQNTAMVIGLFVFAVIAIARLAGRATENTRLTLGVPITIIMAPALFNSLAALGEPDLQAVDWWRFGILLTASLIMLVLGTLRETAGLFFPGLFGVLLSALPYGFKQTQKEQWFLWVLLLVIAGFMVWLAMRLERMRKQGRTSAAWLRELK